jgi:hypothetical protein
MPNSPRRIVPDMLLMPALKVSDPVEVRPSENPRFCEVHLPPVLWGSSQSAFLSSMGVMFVARSVS